MLSLWERTAEKPKFEKLQGDISTDVLVIGGGIAGILCAYQLQRSGVNYVLAEAKEICGGITKNTTAKITSSHSLIYDKLIRQFGIETAKLYLKANEAAIESYRRICLSEEIDCDLKDKDSFVYSMTDREKIEKEAAALKKLGYCAEVTDNIPLPFKTAGAIRFKRQAEFDPLKFLYALSKGLNIYENTRVRELIGTTATTDSGRIKANKIIVATHFPFINKHGSYFLKMYQHRSYVIALEGAENVQGMYVDENKKGLSFRNYGDLLLIGGGSHRTGKRGTSYDELRKFAKKYFPNAKEKYHFATQDCMTLDSVPYVGRYSKSTKDLYVITGFNKWGMTSAMVGSSVICNLIRGKSDPLARVFSPSRSILRPQLILNAFEAVSGLITPSKRRCPHLGCALKWNPYEHTWDCSCHGSRFTSDGKLIDNPSTGDLKTK
ncbi:MAG: FAD-dependent oxidoreductase [Clostridia bacterium]|nr:FAD-dependent oxidoreductase [Clostridia bacterium]